MTHIPNFVLLFFSSFFFVGLKSIQQLNVARSVYKMIVPTSMLMACLEVYTIVSMSKTGLDQYLILVIGVGSGMGSLAATMLHDKLGKNKGKHG